MNIVRELRKSKGIQQKELALIIGVAQPTVSEWEKNKKDPSGERLKKLSEYFGVDELVILGKNVVIMEDNNNVHIPKTEEAKILSTGIDLMPPDKREKALNLIRLMFEEYFERNEQHDDNA